MAQFPTSFGGSLDIWAITVEERAKHDQQFHSLKPTSGFITGDQARNFFFQSGLPQPVLAQIWALADMNNDGRMDQIEFSIAMKLIKLKLQGYQLPAALPPVMKQQPVAISGAPTFGIGGIASMPSLTAVAPVPMASIPVVGMSPPLVSSVPTTTVPPLANGAPSVIQPLPAFAHPATLPKSSSFSRSGPGSQLNTKLQKAQSFDVASASPAAEWAVPQSSRLKYRQLFNSHDKTMSGHLTGPQARTILMQSSLPQTQLATIWNLSDIDQDGKLTAEEFILAMHLIDVAMSGQPLPPVLPPEYIPPSFRRVRSGSGISVISSVSVDQRLPEEPVLEEEQQQLEKKLPEEELLYLSFVEDVTDEILKLGLFSNRVLERLFERHIEQNKHHLEEKKMRHMLHVLKVDLGCTTPEGKSEKLNGTINMSDLFDFEKLGTPEEIQLTDENEITVSPSKSEEHQKSLDLHDKILGADLTHKEMASPSPSNASQVSSKDKYSEDNVSGKVISETNLEPSAQSEEPSVSYTSSHPVSPTESFEEGGNDLESLSALGKTHSEECVQNSIKEDNDHDTKEPTSKLTETINEQNPLDN